MTAEETFRRVDADLERGDLGTARMRLASLLASPAGTSEVRTRLVEVCRLAGDPVAAGTYGFLTDDVREEELAALAQRYGDRPVQVLRAVLSQGRPAELTAAARERLGGPTSGA